VYVIFCNSKSFEPGAKNALDEGLVSSAVVREGGREGGREGRGER